MWSAAVRLGAFAAIATFACYSAAPAPRTTPIENRGALAQAPDADEHYACSIMDSGYEYPPFQCVIRFEGNRRVLLKLGGSQRFRGVVTPKSGGLAFDGEFYCPFGDCTKHLTGIFQMVGDGRMRGTFNEDGMVVTLVREDGRYGGGAYGGGAYGGGAYGAGAGGTGNGAMQPMTD
jgi:hypothetical protein